MAQRVWISEFATVRQQAAAPFAQLPVVASQVIDVGSGSAVTSQPFQKTTRYIRVTCEVRCAIRIPAPATSSDLLMPAMSPEYFGVAPGQTLSAISAP